MSLAPDVSEFRIDALVARFQQKYRKKARKRGADAIDRSQKRLRGLSLRLECVLAPRVAKKGSCAVKCTSKTELASIVIEASPTAGKRVGRKRMQRGWKWKEEGGRRKRSDQNGCNGRGSGRTKAEG